MSRSKSVEPATTYPMVDDQRPGLQPPRFRLSTLFYVVTAICCVLVAINAAGPLGGSVMLLFLLAIAAHVFGNAIGTRLRHNGSIVMAESDEPVGGKPSSRVSHDVRSTDFAPPSRLSRKKCLGRSMLVLSGVGAMLGAAGGGWLLAIVNSEHRTIYNMALGASSFAVLGGLWGFWMSSFLRVFIDAVLHASKPQR